MSWLERLANRKVRLSVFAKESKQWDTCVVGEAGEAVEFRGDVPKDKTLETLGEKFHYAVEDNDRKTALKLYLAIQRRVLKLAGLRAK